MSETKKSKHAFGSEDNLSTAIESGLIDEYDILFLSNKKIGWIDKDKNIVMAKADTDSIQFVDELPTENQMVNSIYVFENEIYKWNGEEWVHPLGDSVATPTDVETAVTTGVEEAKSYADDLVTVVEF